MKKRILSVISLVVAVLAFTSLSASACRQGPLWDGGCLTDVDAGTIDAGCNPVTITGNECKVFSFTPETDGFYELTYTEHGCVFMKEGPERYYDYLLTSYSIDGTNYTTEIYNFKAGETYKLYVADESTYFGAKKDIPVTSIVWLIYLGKITDYDILTEEYMIREDGTIGVGGSCIPERYLDTSVNVSFENGAEFLNCELLGNCCFSIGVPTRDSFIPREGKMEITVSLFDVEKEFEVSMVKDEPENENNDSDMQEENTETAKSNPNTYIASFFRSCREAAKDSFGRFISVSVNLFKTFISLFSLK